ncbi:hypothetical protein ABC977_17120 [Thioalkalicoccus limnaeus]|uniref:Iron transporter n=1 Tax=Thioalkalicoccus limnaeus TaxID=120681 RepID=A0ABV4BHZ2_9GAMM
MALNMSRWLRPDKDMALRLPVASRTGAAVLGGYALAHTLPLAVTAAMGMPAAEAVLAAIQLSFVVYAGAVLWAFAARSVLIAWFGLLLPATLAGLVAWGLG